MILVLVTLAIVAGIIVPSDNHSAPAVAQDCQYKEAPMLAAKVASGELPSVCERLPENPRVVEPIESVGVYGGIWHRAWRGIDDFHSFGRLNYDPVLRWPRDPSDPVQPGLAERWEWNEDSTELTLFFRLGLKWSDGTPWTVDDIIFWWEAIETDTNVTVNVHTEWQTLEELIKVDDNTITLRFSEPNGLAETVGLAFHGSQWPLGFERFGFYAPKHYLEQFHPAYSSEGSYELFEEKSFDYNVDRPVMTAWKIVQYEAGDTLMVAERNPYYYAVDIEGNQLPYIDQQYYHLVEGTEGVNAMGIAGNLSMQARAIDLAKYPIYYDNRESGDYHMLLWPQAQASAATLWFNQSYPDEKYRTLFQSLAFRRAMSHAINRDAINEIAFLGQGIPRTQTVVPDSPYYQEDIETIHAEHNPGLSKQLLEGEVGLVMGDDGFYNFPDGSDILIVIETSITATGMTDSLELISSWWNELGIRTEVETMTRDVYWPRAGSNEVMVATWTTDRGLVPMVDPIYQFPFDERSWMAPAYGLWYKTNGAEGMEPTDEFKQAMALYDEYKRTTDPARQLEIGREIVRLSTTNLWSLGTVGMVPNPVVVKNNFMNVPDSHTADWIIMTPGTLDPAHFYFADGGE